MAVHIDGHCLVRGLNQKAMDYLSHGEPSKCFENLQQSLRFMEQFEPNEDILKLQAMTFNNIGCYYKHTFQPKKALHYLQMACEMEHKLGSKPIKLASSLLNLCVVLSDLGKHQQSLKTGLKAFSLLQGTEKNEDLLSLVAFNIGVEYEYANDPRTAVFYYQQAVSLSNDNLLKKKFLAGLKNASIKLGKGNKRRPVKRRMSVDCMRNTSRSALTQDTYRFRVQA